MTRNCIVKINTRRSSKSCATCKHFCDVVTAFSSGFNRVLGTCKNPNQTMTGKEVEFAEYPCWEEK